MNFLKEFILFFIPRYVTDRVALSIDENLVWSVYCLEGQERVGDEIFIEAYGTIKIFTWFGFTKGEMVKLDDEAYRVKKTTDLK